MMFVVLLSSCSKEELAENSGLKEETANSNENLHILSAGDNQYDLLGYGYDITGRYANSESAKLQVVDIQKFISQHPSDYDVNTNVEQYFEYYGGGNAYEYADTLSQKYKASLNLTKAIFSAEAHGTFNTIGSFSSKYAYASINMNIKQKRLRIFAETATLRNSYLSANFKSDLNTLSPSSLVQKYGTHVLTNITLGAKFNMGYRTQTNNSNRKEAVKAGASFNGLFKIFGMSADINYSQSAASSNFEQTLFYRTIGGDGTKGLIGELNLDASAPKLTIANWQSTCTPANAALIDIDKDGFIPLEELITDPTKKAAVKSYINQYINDHQVQLIYETVPVYSYYSASGNDHYSIPAPTIGDLGTYWAKEGINFYAYDHQVPGTVPIYSYRNDTVKDHYSSPGTEAEVNASVKWWISEGIGFYAFNAPGENRIPIYSYINNTRSDHYLSPDPNLAGSYWVKEGISFYAPTN